MPALPLTRRVRARLINRSHEQPVIIATAAGGKMIAMTARMMSEPWTIVTRCEWKSEEQEVERAVQV